MKKKPLIILATLIAITLAGLGFLSYGNPQVHKYVYMWQAYVWPAERIVRPYLTNSELETAISRPPENYTGEFRVWNKGGTLKISRRMVSGKVLRYQYYFDNGNLKMEQNISSQRLIHGVVKHFYTNGQLKDFSVFVAGERTGFQLYYRESGIVRAVLSFRNGTYFGIQKNFDDFGELEILTLWDGRGQNRELNGTRIFDDVAKIDLRPQYAKEIAAFEAELKKFEKEHGLK